MVSSASYVNQNNVRPDLTDILKGYHNIGFTVEKSKNLISAGNHDLFNTACALVKFQIGYPAELFTILYIDDILAF